MRKIIRRSYEAPPVVEAVPPSPAPAGPPAGQAVVRVSSAELRANRAPTPALSKSDFVRAQPATMTAAEIVQAGRKHGLALTAGLVHSVRSRARKNPGPPRKRGRPRKSEVLARQQQQQQHVAAAKAVRPAAKAATTSALSTDERELARILLSVGLDRAEQLLGQLRRALG